MGEKRGAASASRRELAVAVAFYVLVALAATALGAALLGFFTHGVGLPIAYADDTLLTSASVKGIIDNGQPFTNPYLAAPGTSTLFDFPGAEGFFLIELWALSLFSSEYAVVLNLFVLLGYPLVALAAAWSLRRLDFARPVAAAIALLYACIPYHQSRAVLHQSLSAYFAVPLAVALVCVIVFQWRKRDEAGQVSPWRLPAWAWVVIVLIGMSGVYYAYFAMALAIVAAVLSAWASRDLRRLAPAGIVVAGIFVVILVQMVPSLIYWQQEGRNNIASARVPAEADLYALRLTQLVFPVDGHRIASLAQFKAEYRQSYVDLMGPAFAGIAYDSSLGLVGSVGLVLLLFWALSAPLRRPPPLSGDDDRPAKFAALALTSLLLATVGGVGEIVAYLGFPAIRAYDRMTPYIAFLSLGAVAWLIERGSARLDSRLNPGSGARLAVLAAALAVLLAVGLFDQTTPATMPRYAEIEQSFSSDEVFVAALEDELSDGAMVFQLPYIAFPESAPVGQAAVYDPLRMYLHSETLHWSAGAFRGREDAEWQERVSGKSASDMLAELSAEGFAGIVIDRAGYDDEGAAIERELRAELGAEPLESPDGRFVFYSLAE